MLTRGLLSALLLMGAASFANAGGPPPMYVVVHKVVEEPGKRVPGWIQIWGSFTRLEKVAKGKTDTEWVYSKPVYGYVYLSVADAGDRKFQEDLQDWKQAAGTGKPVAVGACGEGGSLLKCKIHFAEETVAKADLAYTPGHLRLWGDLYATSDLARHSEVVALIKFDKERK